MEEGHVRRAGQEANLHLPPRARWEPQAS